MQPKMGLLPIKTTFFGLFSPKAPNFAIDHPKIPTLFHISPPFFLKQPISDKCTITFRKGISEACRWIKVCRWPGLAKKKILPKHGEIWQIAGETGLGQV